jgi:hypothetical protein
MAKKKEAKPRAEKHEVKVKFEGMLGQMIKMTGNQKATPKQNDK